ncbi:hypothetical protein PAHAL_4G234400 [Panicum hallii]|uniref:Uncharacterized protein n=1 Tax=Panicum hallii TaxID=206008 RepID=A0A2T8JDS6_9POAL|nr:hypothetical protein PAHAL_4G234400 [Panicum hallii]
MKLFFSRCAATKNEKSEHKSLQSDLCQNPYGSQYFAQLITPMAAKLKLCKPNLCKGIVASIVMNR